MKIPARFTVLIISLLVICIPVSGQNKIKLNWQIAPQNNAAYSLSQLSNPGFNVSGWIDGVVPGTVFYAYVKAGKEANPDYADNIYKVDQEKYNRPFWYRAQFSSAIRAAGKRMWLTFNGINKRGEVYLNGKHIGTVNGLADRNSYDITGMLAKQTNVIAVLVTPPNSKHALANREAPTYLSSGSWDWMPAVPGLNSGITDAITITTTGAVTVTDPWIQTRLLSKQLAELTLKVNLHNNSKEAITGRLRAVITPGNIVVNGPAITLQGNGERAFTYTKADYPQLAIKNPSLWWPNGYGGKADGTQHLYTCKVSFETNSEVSDAVSTTFGIRKVSADTTTMGGPLRVYVNDVPILIKGGNWGMSDYMLKVHGKDYETRIRLHQQMNFNMIRNWTGEVTDEDFYKYCDKYGIMVWDDFWLNNFGPIDSLAVFQKNAVEKVKKLRNHPSIVIWCGANEGVPGGSPKSELNTVIKNAVKKFDGDDKLYLARSNAGETNPNFSIHGGSRVLSGSGIWANVDPKTYFTDPHNGYLFSKDSYGMRSELGMATFVNIESFKKFMPPSYWLPPTPEAVASKTNMWARHFFSTDGALGGGADPVRYINDINNSYGESTSIEEFCRKAQLQNVESSKAMFEAWNDHMWNDATGMLMWMSQSAYPSMIWQTYDYYYDLTGAYFGAKTACEPTHIQWNAATNSVKIINNRPYNIKTLTARADVYNMDGTLAKGYSIAKIIDVKATSATEAFVVFKNIAGLPQLSDVHYLKLKLTNTSGQTVSENFYWIGNTYLSYKALNKLPSVRTDLSVSAPKVRLAANGINKLLTYTIINQSKSTAAFCIRTQLLNAAGKQILPAMFSDGYFSLMQNERKELNVEVDPAVLGNRYRLNVRPFNN